MEDITRALLKDIKDKDKISISYIQREYSLGFVKAHNVFETLVEKNYIVKDGTVNKDVIRKDLGEDSGLKIIFLDVDGVLNSRNTKDTCGAYVGIEDKKVILLKELVDKTGAIIVLVSTWKDWWTKHIDQKHKQDELANYLDAKLAKQGLKAVDKTSDYNAMYRGDGILKYILSLNRKGNYVDKMVILDDEPFDYKATGLTKYLIQTSYEQGGLQEKHIRKAIEKLC